MNHADVITRPRIQPLGWAIICAVVALTLGVAGVAFMTSYGALYSWVDDANLYSDLLDHLWPLLLDAAFIGAELAAILSYLLRGRPSAWAITVMVITGLLTIFFNVAHAGTSWSDWSKWFAAALPPILMMLMFQIDLAIVTWVRRALGKSEQAFGGAGFALGVPQMAPQMYQPSPTPLAMGQNGHQGGGGEATTKGLILAVADQIGTTELNAIGPKGVAEHLAEFHGITTTSNYVRNVLSESGHMTGRNGHGKA